MTYISINAPCLLMYTQNNQNVHYSSIHNSANKSLDIILKYEPKKYNISHTRRILSEIQAAYRKYKRVNKIMHCILPGFFLPSLPLNTWCRDTTIHSKHGISYKTLLMKVWAIIAESDSRQELEMILCEELEASRHVCFTGRFTRTLNTLSGFIDGVQVGISLREQMHNQIAKAIEKSRIKYKDNIEFVGYAREQVTSTLTDFGVQGTECQPWLDALDATAV